MNNKDEQRKKDLLAIFLWLGVTLLKLLPVIAVIALILWVYSAVNTAMV
ncbi:hypothetical protein [Huintestinicola sp.]